MNIQVVVAFCLWPIVSLWLVNSLGPARGLVASVVGGFLLLPFVSFEVANGLPPVRRDGVIAVSVLAATLAFAPSAFTRYRFHWMDAIVLGALAVWGLTNFSNGIGVQQALLDWWWFAMFAGIPYFLGRCVLDRPQALVVLAVGIVAGTVLMIPFVLLELRMSPKLHGMIYGNWGNTVDMFRYDGWRPKVFQPVGLGLAIWLAASAVVAVGLWLSKAVPAVWRIPVALVAGACLVFCLLGRGGGAISLMVGGVGILTLSYWSRKPRLTLMVPAAVGLYLLTAFTDLAVPVRPFMLSAGEVVWGERSGESLHVRMANEAFLVAAAMQRPLLGWGGWGDFRSNLTLAREMGVGRVLTDGFWVIVLGQRGLLGVVCLYSIYLLPGIMAVNAAVRAGLGARSMALVAGLALFCWLYAADLLLNAFATPVLGLTAGSLTSFAVSIRSMSAHRRRAAMATTTVARDDDPRSWTAEVARRAASQSPAPTVTATVPGSPDQAS